MKTKSIQTKNYIPVEEAFLHFFSLGMQTRAILDRKLAVEMPVRLAGKTDAQCRVIWRAIADETWKALSKLYAAHRL